MKIKHTKKLLLVLVFTLSTISGLIVPSSSAEAITCPNGAEYHDTDQKCYLKKTWSVSGDNGETCMWSEDTSYRGKVSNGQCVAYKATNGTPTYDNGSPLRYSCPNDAQYHADRNECYQEKIQERQNLSDGDVGDDCDAGQGTDNKGYTGEIRKENGKYYCYGYKKTNDKPSVVNEDGAVVDENGNRSGKNYCDATYVSEGKDNQTKNKAACIAGQADKDCNTYTVPAEKAACESGKRNKSSIAPANGLPPDRKLGDAGQCGKAKTNLIDCGSAEGVPALANVLKIILFVMTIVIGIVATGGIAYGAILYASAEDNAGQISKAKGIIRDVAIGLVLYGFMIAIINWLVPSAPVEGGSALESAKNGSDPTGQNSEIVDSASDGFSPFD